MGILEKIEDCIRHERQRTLAAFRELADKLDKKADENEEAGDNSACLAFSAAAASIHRCCNDIENPV